jgi:hypothetical protein
LRLVDLPVLAGLLGLLAGCVPEEASQYGDPNHPLDYHPLLPQYWPGNGQIAAGRPTGLVLDQPIAFSHYVHATELSIDCQYCHYEARRSIHSGVPPLQTCMGCHAYEKLESPEVQKIHQAWCGQPKCTPREDEFGRLVPEPNSVPLEWSKVHDLPDYVHFNHQRHIKGGVNCTECHGQIKLQGQYTLEPIPGDPQGRSYRKVEKVMVRETSLQMGWCLDCHASHPSIDTNYGEAASLRRAELKDCWTCHK